MHLFYFDYVESSNKTIWAMAWTALIPREGCLLSFPLSPLQLFHPPLRALESAAVWHLRSDSFTLSSSPQAYYIPSHNTTDWIPLSCGDVAIQPEVRS